ncbi:trigger factor [Candidatus Uhrbacteria bacterium]|nr:trigger factor [Candidatus Uhrbacteria bacterium]
MQTILKELPKSEIELEITLQPEEIKTDIEAAAKRISESSKIPGFRPGHVPYEMVKARVGEMKIWEEALETAIRRTYHQALKEHKLATVGQPYFSVLSLAPGNPVVYKVKTAILPKISKLADYKSIKINKKEIKISDADIDAALGELSRMQVREKEVDRAAASQDKVMVDMNMFLDKVPLEGGQTKNHGIYLAENYYIPGIQEKLLGIKKGETREFVLPFPKEHYQKNVAGKDVEFRVMANSVLELERPALDDSFAQSLGQKTVTDLRRLIGQNLEKEAALKEVQREEIEILEELVSRSSFDEVPDILVNSEIERMLRELEDSIAAQGLEWNKYLEGIKKTVPELKLDFTSRALKRVKIALIIREISDREGIEPDDAEVSREIGRALNQYKNDPEAQKIIRGEEYAEEARIVSRNRKTIEFLRQTALN